MRDRADGVHNSYASSLGRIPNAFSIDLSQQTHTKTTDAHTQTHKSNLISCLSVIHCFLTEMLSIDFYFVYVWEYASHYRSSENVTVGSLKNTNFSFLTFCSTSDFFIEQLLKSARFWKVFNAKRWDLTCPLTWFAVVTYSSESEKITLSSLTQ